jgi:outer membrane protein OmpA-like peptidoglycan-associated protein
MRVTGRGLLLATGAALLAWCVMPSDAQAQSILRRIKDQAAKKVQDGRAKIDSAVMSTASTAMDSAVSKTNRGTNAVAGRVTDVANGAIAATEHGLTRALTGGGTDVSRDYAARLAQGRLVLDSLRFVAGSDQPDASADVIFARLVTALGTTTGTLLIEGHVDASTSAADAQSLSQKRASAVKARLVAAGVLADRLLAVGYGTTRPNTENPQASARIEIVRAQ